MYGFISILPAVGKICWESFFHYSTILLLEQNNFFVLYGKRNKITILPVNEEERKETGKKALTAVQPKTGGFSGWNQYKYGDM